MSGVSGGVIHKLVKLDGLSLYWDNNTKHLSKLPVAEMRAQLKNTVHSYLLEPVSGKALLKRNTTTMALRSLVRIMYWNDNLVTKDVCYPVRPNRIFGFVHF